MAGYDIAEVPMSWINRTLDMGSSSFRVLRVAPDYMAALLKLVVADWRNRRARCSRFRLARTNNGVVVQGIGASKWAGDDRLAGSAMAQGEPYCARRGPI